MLLALAGAFLLAVGTLDDRRAAIVLRSLRQLDPRRRAQLRERRLALPGLIDAVAAALASGLSITQAFAEVARTLPRPLAIATERAAAALTLGTSIDEALRSYEGAVPAGDLAPFAIVLSAFARSGGRIARSLARVASLVRGRLALEDERDALTAQGRMSAIVLVSLAPLGGIFFALMTPDYVAAATRFGSPLSDMLVTQTDLLRAADRRRAETQARRLPVLMLFPLAFCVLPALLAVFLGPPLLSLLG